MPVVLFGEETPIGVQEISPVFLEVCREKGIEPRRGYSGQFNLRITPELRERLAIAAQAEGKRINTLAQAALEKRIAP